MKKKPVFLSLALIVLILVLAVYYFSNKGSTQNTITQTSSSTQPVINKTLVAYDNSHFLSLSYPKEFKLKEVTPELQLFIYPQPQPIEFGPFISFTVRESGLKGLLNDVKNQYKDLLLSYEEVKINDRDWIHAVIRDGYFEEVVYEYYFTAYRKAGYLEVVYSKGEYSSDFFSIITTARGF